MTDEIEQLKNIFSYFKILAAKFSNDNKNKNKKLDETEEKLEICKREYQKLCFEHENLRKKYDNLVTQYNRMKKTKLIQAEKIFFPQNFEETESEKSDEENEEEEQTEEESEVDEVIPQKKPPQKTHTSKKKIPKKSNKRTTKKQVGIIDYINK